MHITNENLDCAIITLFIHNVCNYNCSYCDDYPEMVVNVGPDWKSYIDPIEKCKKNKYSYVEVLGGESHCGLFQDFVDTISPDKFL